MSIITLLQQAQNGLGVSQLAERFGLSVQKANDLVDLLVPEIGFAAQRRAKQGALGKVLTALKGTDQSGYFDDALAAASVEGQEQGLDFLEQLMGARLKAKWFAHEAAKRTNIEEGIVQQFMPALAVMIQGGLQRHFSDALIEGMQAYEDLQCRFDDSDWIRSIAPNNGHGQRNSHLTILATLLGIEGDGSITHRIPQKCIC